MNSRYQYEELELNPNNNEYSMSGKLNNLYELWFTYKYDYLTLDEKLTLMLGNMMYCNTDFRDLTYDNNEAYQILVKCNGRSWKQACKLIHEFYGIKSHEIDKQSMLLKSIRTFLQSHYNCTRPNSKNTVCSTRSELGHALRLYHLLGYDKSPIYDILSEFQKMSHISTFDYIACQLKKSNTWKKWYIHDVMYWADRIALDINLQNKNK